MLTQLLKSVALALIGLLLVTQGPSEGHAEVPTGVPEFSNPLLIDNTYLPFVDYRIRLYRQKKGGGDKHVIDVFTGKTRTFEWNGGEVECAELQEWEVEECAIVEISLNYFAQADDGTVYYFGEVVDEYEDGEVVSHGGSWLVGGPKSGDPDGTVTADDPTVFMPANPEVGDTWKAEDLPDEGIEEFDEVEKILRKHKVPAGKFRNVLKVREETPDVGYKWYAPGIGFIQQADSEEVIAMVEIEDSDDAEDMEEELEEILEELLCQDDDDDDDDEDDCD